MTATGRLARGTLDAGSIVDAAFEVAAQVGVDTLTVPMVAGRLGVQPSAIYWHFRRKDDLLRALDGEALQRFNARFRPLSQASWRAEVEAYWREYRRILRDDPLLCELVIVRWARSTRSAAALRRHYERIEGQVAVLLAAGFTPQQAAQGYHALSTYTRGCLLNERSARDVTPRTPGGRADAGLPALARVDAHWNTSFATEADFGAGLDLLLTGLEALLAGRRRGGAPT